MIACHRFVYMAIVAGVSILRYSGYQYTCLVSSTLGSLLKGLAGTKFDFGKFWTETCFAQNKCFQRSCNGETAQALSEHVVERCWPCDCEGARGCRLSCHTDVSAIVLTLQKVENIPSFVPFIYVSSKDPERFCDYVPFWFLSYAKSSKNCALYEQ